MAQTAQVSFRIDEELKQSAERALDDMGLTMSAAITVFLTKVARERRIPFEISASMPVGRKPVVLDRLTKKELDAELEKGMDDIRSGRVYTESEVFEEMRRLYGI
ncbi:MAG: type II toxin-antitoxin system RelB/DinJ family antitoxin [Oscillospiraceae bacterium]|nr:type II toxin-antitoxin system RelB/DinJ family antitoxin [Oscillospiraceae bacterium]